MTGTPMTKVARWLTVLTLLSSAQAAKTSVTLGGKAVPLDSVVVGGKTYVSLDGLKAALGAAGGANQLVSAEGCMNEWLFDGVWRLRVTKVAYVPNPKDGTFWGWLVTAELRNGTQTLINLFRSGVEDGISIVTRDGNTIGMGRNSSSPPKTYFDNGYTDLPNGAGVIMPIPFYAPDGASEDAVQANPPVKFLLPIDLKAPANHNLKLPYSSAPNFRVDLTCKK